ncbi:hypothetical protein [Bacteroides xylanisolvens]|jgi:hypothetical protein|uniref:Uncharacterized protein n=1 Tax=Bacteroides xylanisolvens TaxID=371601 RepID=A0A921I8Y4_9BACE|nr:hypothetical protein [Bacteroides xylanisolvens]HJG13602.1 hypothetical protein [Bacteroides xylanisolvens]
MKAKLKYPIFWSSPNDNRIYVFWKEKENKTTKLDMLKEANGWKGDMIMMPPKQNTSSNALT